MTKILIVRHGQSDSNASKSLTGQRDSKLSEMGLKQAELVSEYIYKNYKIDEIHSSDLTRAVQTLTPLAKTLGLEIIKTPKLRELNCGDWQGQKISDLLQDERYLKWKNEDLTIQAPNGESFVDVQARAYNYLETIAKNSDGKTIAMSLHGGPIRMILAKILDIPPSEWHKSLGYVNNASTTLLNYENGKFTILSTTDDYLGELSTEMPKGL
ncbi:MAG: histidine phosphatase family protein [Clostridia bacterium]|nr:histidine phosphatase family protein [Clostridia bacterium]